MDWFFDGLGTMLLGLILGAGLGGPAGYGLAIRSVRQKQRAGDNATQTQVGRDQIQGKRPR